MLEKPQEQTSMQEKTENMQQRRKKWLFSERIPYRFISSFGIDSLKPSY